MIDAEYKQDFWVAQKMKWEGGNSGAISHLSSEKCAFAD